ncbi:hypothetical protein MMC30_005569 [Trapelia coarctata]|nr:hypothetical protein [Trapelia coarctata]
MDSLVLALLLLLIIALYSVLLHLNRLRSDPREPPVVSSKIPFFGHIIGLLRHGSGYFDIISVDESLPICCLKLFTAKIYVVSSLPLISAVHRNSRTISFTPFVKLAAARLSGLGQETLKHFDKDEQRLGLSLDTVKATEHALHPDRDGASMNLSMLTHLKELLDEASMVKDEPQHLLAWVKHGITQASTRAMYGPLNPFLDKDLEDAFWTFELNAAPLLLNFAPSVIAKKAVDARNRIAEGFLRYYKNKGQDQGSALARARYSAPAKYGLSEKDIALLEVPFLLAVVANTVPTTFWALSHTYSRPDLLDELREELAGAVTRDVNDGKATYTVEITKLKQNCPLLLSVYHEILRTHSVLPSTREVLKDTLLNDQYLVKQGANIQMSTRLVHYDPETWGPDAHVMDLRRFLRKDQQKLNSLKFRTFGGAPHICPGRHFATTEIVCTIAFMVMRYELVPVTGSWNIPKQDQSVFAGVPPPVDDIAVFIKERPGWQGEWSFRMGDPNLRFALASG